MRTSHWQVTSQKTEPGLSTSDLFSANKLSAENVCVSFSAEASHTSLRNWASLDEILPQCQIPPHSPKKIKRRGKKRRRKKRAKNSMVRSSIHRIEPALKKQRRYSSISIRWPKDFSPSIFQTNYPHFLFILLYSLLYPYTDVYKAP